jgi:hypothetical protein
MTQLKLRTADLFFGLVDRLRAAATWEFVPLININRDYQLLSQGQLHREAANSAGEMSLWVHKDLDYKHKGLNVEDHKGFKEGRPLGQRSDGCPAGRVPSIREALLAGRPAVKVPVGSGREAGELHVAVALAVANATGSVAGADVRLRKPSPLISFSSGYKLG